MNKLHGNDKGLSFPLLLTCGIIAAFFILISVLFIQKINLHWSPTTKNIQRYLKKGKYSEALALVNNAKDSDIDQATRLLEKGKIWLFLAIEKENRNRWRDYGQDRKDWLKSSEAEKAETFIKEAININNSSLDAHFYLGLLYMEKGWFSSAEHEFLSVLSINNHHFEARRNLGIVYTEMRRFDLAEKELRNALKINPNNPSIAKNLSWLYRFYLNKQDSAIVWANRYLNMQPQNDKDIKYVRDELIKMLKRYPEYFPDEPMEWKKPRRFKSRFAQD